MKNDRFSCIYTEDRHEELRYDGGRVYQWCTTRHHVPRGRQLHALSCKYPLCQQEPLYEALLYRGQAHSVKNRHRSFQQRLRMQRLIRHRRPAGLCGAHDMANSSLTSTHHLKTYLTSLTANNLMTKQVYTITVQGI